MKSFGPRTYRATVVAWIGEFALPVVFFAMLVHLTVTRAGLHPALAALGLFVLTIVAAKVTILPMVRSWIQFGYGAIEGSVDGRHFHLHYAEILAAWLIERKRRRFLCLGTRNATIIFPLQFFDEGVVWGEITLCLPPEVVGDQAVERLPDYRNWASERDNFFKTHNTPCAVTDRWALQIIGWGGLTFGLFSLVASFQNRNLASSLFFGAFTVCCVSILFRWGITEINASYVRRNTMVSRYSITWAEVVRIEKDPLGFSLVLLGKDCQLVLPGPSFWSPVGKKQALELLEAQARMRNIPTQNTILALLKFSHRTRMAR